MDKVWTVASTLVRRGGPPVFAVWLLLAHNPLLLDCTAFWADRLGHRLCWLGRWAKWLGALLEAWRHVLPEGPAPGHPPPRWPAPPPPPRRLCSNGDHSNVEETRIVVGEHVRRILGTVVLAVVLSWIVAPSSSPVLPSPTPVVETNLLPDPWADGSISTDDVHVDVDPHMDDNTGAGTGAGERLPPRYYRRPRSPFPHGADPRVRIQRDVSSGEVRDVVVRRSTPSTPPPRANLPPIGASGFAAARKAARAAQNAAADQWVLALRQRLVEQNREDSGKSVGSLHADDHDHMALARSAFGLGYAVGSGDANGAGIDVDSLFGDVVRRREGYGENDDRFDLDNPHDRPDDTPW